MPGAGTETKYICFIIIPDITACNVGSKPRLGQSHSSQTFEPKVLQRGRV